MRNQQTGGSIRGLLLLTALLAFGLGCPPAQVPDDSAAPAGDEQSRRAAEGAVIAAHKSLIRGFETGNVEAIVGLLEPTSELLIFHPFKENRFDGVQEAREGLGRMLGRLQQLSWTEVHPIITVRNDVAWLTSQVLVKSAAREEPFVGRGTEIWIRHGDDWRLIHGHWSEHARLAGEQRPG